MIDLKKKKKKKSNDISPSVLHDNKQQHMKFTTFP